MRPETVSEHSPRMPASGEPVLPVADVSRTFHRGPPWHRRTVRVLRDASLDVHGRR